MTEEQVYHPLTKDELTALIAAARRDNWLLDTNRSCIELANRLRDAIPLKLRTESRVRQLNNLVLGGYAIDAVNSLTKIQVYGGDTAYIDDIYTLIHDERDWSRE